MLRRTVLIAGLALLAGCATRPAPVLAPAGAPLAELEPLYSAAADRHGVVIEVASGGCTAKADFAFYVERRGEAVTLAFGRKKLDPCRAFAAAKARLTFTYEELGLTDGAPVFLLNPLTAWRGP